MTAEKRKRVRLKLFEIQRGRCCYCAVEMFIGFEKRRQRARENGLTTLQFLARVATLEHLRRKAEGGTDRIDNLALACNHCNARRGDTNWCEFKTITAIAA